MNRIEDLKARIASFDDALFGTRTPMEAGAYPMPPIFPKKGQHPRLNVNAEMLPKVKKVLEDKDASLLASNFWELADEDFDGFILLPPSDKSNYDGRHHAIIEAKALAYLLTGDEEYGYEAIFAAKNYMLSIVIRHDLKGDIFRGWGRIMTVMGEVYDWCYDLMTDSDRDQFIRGIEWKLCRDCTCGKGDKMTIGYPPSGQSAVQGHGTNVALQRDYLGCAIAVYDEYPDWWNYIGGRFYAEFVPANNVFYPAGMNTQGTNNYVWGKFYAQLHSAWLIKAMSGEHPYHKGIEDVVYGLIGMKMPNGKYFSLGDGGVSPSGAGGRVTHLAVAAALFPSAVLKHHARVYTNDYTLYDWDIGGSMMSPSLYAIFLSSGYEGKETESVTDGLDLVYYYGSPMGQMTVRSDWGEDAAAVMMRVSELSGGNHDHEDAGTFQIYYKGCYSAESGHYGAGAGYGTAHHKFWHQGTIAHNALLVYNPAHAENDRGWYSGGQTRHGGTSTVDEWLNTDKQKTGKITAHGYRLGDDGKPEYAYLAGDITKAYSRETVKRIERRMLTVYTGDKDFPMFFTVYDNIVSTDPAFKKSFLMYSVNEPTVEGNVAISVQNSGKIVLTSLTEGASMTKYGGAGQSFWINEEKGNLDTAEDGHGTAARKGESDTIAAGAIWGRVQIDCIGKVEDHLLNVIYVTDADNEKLLVPVRFENDRIIGMRLNNVVTAFVKSEDKLTEAASFTIPGVGECRCHVSGIAAGKWSVTADGNAVGTFDVTEEEGLLVFSAPAGEVGLEKIG